MKGFFRQISPRGAIADLIHEWRAPNPYRWQVLGVSVAATFTLMVLVIPESERAEPRPPRVSWITTFAPDRTDAEIRASNEANQRLQERLRAERAEREEQRKEAFRTLGRATGLDVDALEKQYSDESPTEKPAPATRPAENPTSGD